MAKVIEVSAEGGDITPTANQVSPPKYTQITLKVTKVEVVEMSEVFSEVLLQHWQHKSINVSCHTTIS
jgi:hypothetical protein